MRKILVLVVIAVACLTVASCSKNGGDTNLTPTSVVTEAVTPTVTSEPTGTPTPTVTATPVPATDLAALAARNRELHEEVFTKRAVNPLGTAPAMPESEKRDRAYGISRSYWPVFQDVVMETGSIVEETWTVPHTYLRISGLRDEAVQKKVNDRLESIVRNMSHPNFLPDIAGIMTIVKEHGLPQSKVHEYHHCEAGILSVEVEATWYWEEERVFANDEELAKFCEQVDWADARYEILDGYSFVWNSPVRMVYQLYGTYYLNFDLSTGEEMSLSDLFPEGYDYLAYLDEKVYEASQYEYWFDHYDGSGAWEQYDEMQEVDSGVSLQISGDEEFHLYDNWLRINTNQGREVSVILSDVVYRSAGELLYSVMPEYTLSPLETVVFYDWEWRENSDEKVHMNKSQRLGKIRAVPSGALEIEVEVKRQKDLPDWESYAGEEWTARAREDLSDEKIVKYAKEFLEAESVWIDYWYSRPTTDAEMLLYCAEVYPNGYYYLEWCVNVKGTWRQGRGYEHFTLRGWVHDGRFIPEEECFDVSYEELFTEIIAGLRVGDREHGKPVATREEAAAAAKALRPYFSKFSDPLGGKDTWSWVQWYVWEPGGYALLKTPDDVSEETFPDLKAALPQELWDSLRGYEETDLYYSDPNLIRRHLRIYEGYSFE
ncbi:MAG: hypothetical protein J5645_08855 [Lachnospiraceae bacterium]|nr:hypothetical protein [Lachnospiraceae bacterium]